MNESTSSSWRVVGIAVRTARRGPMREVEEGRARADGWLEGDHGGSAKRGVTLLSEAAWQAVCREAGRDLAWTTRRANVRLAGESDLLPLVGRRVRLGEIELEIVDETRPCGQMDEAHPGLQEILRPQGRGGVYGRVISGGAFRIGDALEVVA